MAEPWEDEEERATSPNGGERDSHANGSVCASSFIVVVAAAAASPNVTAAFPAVALAASRRCCSLHNVATC